MSSTSKTVIKHPLLMLSLVLFVVVASSLTIVLGFVPSNSFSTTKCSSTGGVRPLQYVGEENDNGRNFSHRVTAAVSTTTDSTATEKESQQKRQVEIVPFAQPPQPKQFSSPLLRKHFGELLEWKEMYGHPNIPLKQEGGNACQVLRRLHIQKKLSDNDVEWLEKIGFRFHSLEDVYRFANFDALLQRLLDYEAAHPNNNYQVPKKCPEDPELGAWVTGIRRLGKDGIHPEHERRLTAIDFVWKSTQKCGSKFMKQFREYRKQVEEEDGNVGAVLKQPKTISWIKAQQRALKKGKLSQTRVQYMGQLFGDTWTTIGIFDDLQDE